MASSLFNVAVDCADPHKLAAFWSKVLARPVLEEDEADDTEAVIELPNDVNLFFQRVPEPKRGKNRLHVCLRPDAGRDVEAERLMKIGATFVEDHRNSDGTGWVVLADPEGNEFCVLRSAAERT